MDENLGLGRTTVHIYTVLLMPDSMSLVWGHSVHFAKYSDSTSFETLLLQHYTIIESDYWTL